MEILDLAPSCHALAGLVASLTDDDLSRPTPCPAYSVADLVDHVGGVARAFTAAALKERLEQGGDPSGDGTRLEEGWRERISGGLGDLAKAWADPAAYDGTTQAGPVELPGFVAARVALNEVVVHGWDLAVATGRPWDADPVAVAVCREFVESFEPPADGPAADGGLFGPPVVAPADASDVDLLVAAAGRDPLWA